MPPRRPEQPVSLALEKSAAVLEKEYECKTHAPERVRFYCQDCLHPLCAECLSAHKTHNFLTGNHDCKHTFITSFLVRENKLGLLKDLKIAMDRKQSELMDFIVYLKDRKKDLKKNMREQLKRISDCFSEVRKCLIFYEQQAVKLVEDQFNKFVDEMEVMGSDSREKAAFLEE